MRRTICLVTLFALVISSCEKSSIDAYMEEAGLPDVELRKEIVPIYNAPTMIIGDVIDIPYTIDNLLNAYQYLDTATKADINPDDIVVTHVYVKFSPKNEEELSVLKNDKHLILFEYPLDREILAYSRSYHDPEVPADMPTYQYCVIPIDYWEELAPTVTVSYEILLKVYMPDDYYYEVKSSSSSYEKLLAMSYKLSGLTYTPATKSSWTPAGTIKGYDNIYNGQVPIPYVEVRGRRLLHVETAYTNVNGYYVLSGSFTNTPEMSVVWKYDDWEIRDGASSQAVLQKSCTFGQNWNVNITQVDDGWAQLHFAAIQRGAYRFMYGANQGLSRIYIVGSIILKYIENGDGYNNYGSFDGDNMDIEIYGKAYSAYRLVSYVFTTTCHELGHMAHYTHAQNVYSNSELRVPESWARFVQYILAMQEYYELGVQSNLFTYSYGQSGILYEDADEVYNFQALVCTYSSKYTPLFIDLFDYYNQYEYYCDVYPNDIILDTVRANDNIGGVSVSTLEWIAFNKTSFYEIKTWLNSYYTSFPSNQFGITTTNVTDVFKPYGL